MEVKKEADGDESEMKLAKTMDSDEDYKFMNRAGIDCIDTLYQRYNMGYYHKLETL